MTKRKATGQIILLLFIVILGVSIGGGLYEARVLVPLWSGALPDSVLDYYQHNLAHGMFAPNQGGRFWIYATPLGMLLTVATLVSSVWTRGKHRKWRIAAATISLAVYVSTLLWFIPVIIRLTSGDVMIMPRDEVAQLASWWVCLNWVRAAVLMTGWLAALRALSISSETAA